MVSKSFLKFLSKGPKETKEIGKRLAQEVLKGKKPKVIALIGELGSGKTTFIKGFASGLKIKRKIISPSFLIFREYSFFYRKRKYKFYHWDLYRVSSKKEILNLGFKEIIKNPKNIVAIEWADKIKGILPKNSLKIYFSFKNLKEREIKIKK